MRSKRLEVEEEEPKCEIPLLLGKQDKGDISSLIGVKHEG